MSGNDSHPRAAKPASTVEDSIKPFTEPPVAKGAISQKLRKLAGSVKLPDDFDEGRELREYLENKHR